MLEDRNFRWAEEPVPALEADGEVLVRNLCLSLDPTQRGWLARDTYLPAVAIGEVVRSGGVGRVEASRNPEYAVGDLVQGLVGWQDYALMKPTGTATLTKLPPGVPGGSWPISAPTAPTAIQQARDDPGRTMPGARIGAASVGGAQVGAPYDLAGDRVRLRLPKRAWYWTSRRVRKRLGLPPAHRAVHPWQARQRGVAAEDQVGEGLSGEVGGGDPIADIAAGPGDARFRIEAHRGAPVARDAEHTAPGVIDAQARGLRQGAHEDGVQPADGFRLGPAADIGP